MHHLVLYSLIFFAVAILGGLAAAGLRGLAAWRALRRFQRNTESGMIDTGMLVGRLEARMAAVTARMGRIDRARSQLDESLATAKVLAGGARELWTIVRLVRGFVPTK